jgi:hypothetical protein
MRPWESLRPAAGRAGWRGPIEAAVPCFALHGNQHAQQGSDCCSIRLREAQQFERQEQAPFGRFCSIIFIQRAAIICAGFLGRILPLQGFEAGLEFECEAQCPNQQPAWYVAMLTMLSGLADEEQFTSVLIKLVAISLRQRRIIKSPLIHEAAHPQGGIDDKAYAWDPKYATLSEKDPVDNADSCAWFAVLVQIQGCSVLIR